jgi:hypothetical protein
VALFLQQVAIDQLGLGVFKIFTKWAEAAFLVNKTRG